MKKASLSKCVLFCLCLSVLLLSDAIFAETFMESQVNKEVQLLPAQKDSTGTATTDNDLSSNPKAKQEPERKGFQRKGFLNKKSKQQNISTSKKQQKQTSDQSLVPITLDAKETDKNMNEPQVTVKEDKDAQVSSTEKEEKELKQITKERKKNTQKTIDAINFIQPSLTLNKEEMDKVNLALTKAEQEQLTILWRATLERNKTIHFIVEKLTPEDKNKKKNQVLSQILNTAIFLPFYALQTVAPTDTSSLASYIGAGLASDLISGQARKNSDKLQLSQTEMVIMFMMIDQVAERLRTQYHLYKQEKIDAILAENELKEAREEAAASLETQSAESRFLSQIRIRQIERELRRINLRVRSNRIVLVDLSGQEAVNTVDTLIDKELAAVIDLPSLMSFN